MKPFLLSLALLGAGCVAEPEVPEPAVPAGDVAAAPAPPRVDDPDAPAAPVAERAPRPAPRWEGNYSVKLQTPGLCTDGSSTCLSFASQVTWPVFHVRYNASDPALTSAAFVFTAEWTPTTSAANVMHFALWSERTGRMFLGEGESPFEARLPRETLGNGDEWSVKAAPDHGGLAYEQTIHVVLRME